ncbi:hypothetical protein Y1Q_0000262 [Alligator mississippiensis]|uniref:Uncharacterized protein n=1 Tax=Alligator mississippiensis TaxID=8496 RepID=A0A151P0B9_ALLMI|nr:hypothetical protein Y1Q_0000262 [Alligator mississippiensis]
MAVANCSLQAAFPRGFALSGSCLSDEMRSPAPDLCAALISWHSLVFSCSSWKWLWYTASLAFKPVVFNLLDSSKEV